VATGFIAKNAQGQVTTLKRNGSDYSATIIGALFRVSRGGGRGCVQCSAVRCTG
jgi:aspartokinase